MTTPPAGLLAAATNLVQEVKDQCAATGRDFEKEKLPAFAVAGMLLEEMARQFGLTVLIGACKPGDTENGTIRTSLKMEGKAWVNRDVLEIAADALTLAMKDLGLTRKERSVMLVKILRESELGGKKP